MNFTINRKKMPLLFLDTNLLVLLRSNYADLDILWMYNWVNGQGLYLVYVMSPLCLRSAKIDAKS